MLYGTRLWRRAEVSQLWGGTREQGGSKKEGRKEVMHAAGRKERNVDAALPALSVECPITPDVTTLLPRGRNNGISYPRHRAD